MATQHLDLDEQEQLATLKHFWHKYGRMLSALAIALTLSYAAWTAWTMHQADKERQSSVRFDELNRAVVSGDLTKIDRVFADMKEQFGASNYTAQAALLDARMNYEKGQVDAAKAALQWVIDSSVEAAYKDIARLRLSGLLIEAKQYDAAIALLSSGMSKSFEGLAFDRMGDAYSLQNKTQEAKAHYLKAYDTLPAGDNYRKMVDVKLARMGVATKDAP